MKLISINNKYPYDWWRSDTFINLNSHHQSCWDSKGIPCQWLHLLLLVNISRLWGDLLKWNSNNQHPSWLWLCIHPSVSVCLSIGSHPLPEMSATSQVSISSLLDVEQNSWLGSSLFFCFQLVIMYNWDECRAASPRLLQLISLNKSQLGRQEEVVDILRVVNSQKINCDDHYAVLLFNCKLH